MVRCPCGVSTPALAQIEQHLSLGHALDLLNGMLSIARHLTFFNRTDIALVTYCHSHCEPIRHHIYDIVPDKLHMIERRRSIYISRGTNLSASPDARWRIVSRTFLNIKERTSPRSAPSSGLVTASTTDARKECHLLFDLAS